jgi:hypothetical protein
MLDWKSEHGQIEAQANTFASFLLMPLDDFREQIRSQEITMALMRFALSQEVEANVADHIKHDNSRELSGLGHDCPPRDRRYWSIKTHSRLALITSWRPDLDPAAASWLGLDGLQRAFRQQADDIQ